jgi:hypothetical protein
MKILSFIFFCLLIIQGKSQFNLHDYFEETAVVHESTVWGNGASFVDFNRDGTDDITTADGNQLVRFFVSNGETFEEVDYQDSRSKMVCQYAEQPSEQTENPNIKNGYNNDSFDNL